MLFDTSILIPYIRGHRYRDLFERHLNRARAWISAVTVLELYAGTANRQEKYYLDALWEPLRNHGFIHVPGERDWTAAGILLSRYSRRFGRIDPRTHQNDLLIALGAVTLGVPLATENAAHMRKWQAVLRAAGMGLQLYIPSREP